MSDRHNNIDELFKQKLGNYEVPPPPATWQQLRKTLPEPLPYYQRPNVVATLVGLALLVGSGIGYWSYQPIQAFWHKINEPRTTQHLPAANPATTTPTTTFAAKQEGSNPAIPTGTDLYSTNTNTHHHTQQEENRTTNSHLFANTEQQATSSSQHATNNQNSRNHRNNAKVILKNDLLEQNQWLHNNNGGIVGHSNAIHTTKNNGSIGFQTIVEANTNAHTTDNLIIPNNHNSNDQILSNTPITTTTTNNNSSSLAVDTKNNNNDNNTIIATPTTDNTMSPAPDNSAVVQPVKALENSANKPAKTIRDKKGRILFPRGFTVGSYYNLNNAWIFSPVSMEQEENTSHQFTFGRAYAFTMGYDFNEKFGISLDWVIKSQQGQVFDQVTHGHLHTKNEVNLTYTHFPLLFHYKFNGFSPFTNQNTILQLVGGMQYSTLKTAEINMTNTTFQNDILTKHAWGFVAGADYDIYLSDNYYVTLGLRSSIMTGATDGRFSLPDHQTTNHLLVGGKVGLNYRFMHK
jgi:hypothetical protein